MFDLDTFLADCLAARRETEPRRPIKEVVTRAVAGGRDIARAHFEAANAQASA
jgi:hypothetical protein